jgi:formate hydrogenlyase subunit 3/multisubunit Na+/H+ antiporter MnhD subunit
MHEAKSRIFSIILAALYSGLNIYCAVMVYINGFSAKITPAAFGFDFSFLVTPVSSLFIILAAVLYLPLTVYTAEYCAKDSDGGKYQFFLYLSFAMLNGALLSVHLGFMLFFWQGLLITMFAMTLMRNHEHPCAAIKTITVAGISDLTLMFGIALTAKAAETGVMSNISEVPATGVGALGCICLFLGAIGKAGCMPLHSWRPTAAEDAGASEDADVTADAWLELAAALDCVAVEAAQPANKATTIQIATKIAPNFIFIFFLLIT